MRAVRILIGFAFAGLAMLSACNGVSHERFEPICYRLTATVETPEGLRSGSSVIKVTWAMSRMSEQFFNAVIDIPNRHSAFEIGGVRPVYNNAIVTGHSLASELAVSDSNLMPIVLAA